MIPKFKEGDFIRDISGSPYCIVKVEINKTGDNYYTLEWIRNHVFIREPYTTRQTFKCSYIENTCHLDYNHAFYKALRELK